MKNLEQVLKEGNSTANQNIKGDFIGKHVFCNVGSLVEPFINSYDIDNAPFTMDDIENFYTYPEYSSPLVFFEGGDIDEKTQFIADLEECKDILQETIVNKRVGAGDIEEINDLGKEHVFKFLKISKMDLVSLEAVEAILDAIDDEITELEHMEDEPQEIYEWWAVSAFMYEKLQALGYPVLDAGSCYVWGRCTTGQAILLDYSITTICANMGILEGQENDWSKY